MLCSCCRKMKYAELSIAVCVLMLLSVVRQCQCHATYVDRSSTLQSDNPAGNEAKTEQQEQERKSLGAKTKAAIIDMKQVVEYDQDTSSGDIYFAFPDLGVFVKTNNGGYQLWAYKKADNDKFMAEASKLQWFSVGRPILVATTEEASGNVEDLFHWDDEKFYVHFQMLSDVDRRRLAVRASRKYGVSITDRQIHNLVLSSFGCYFELDSELYIGSVTDFIQYPLKMYFAAPKLSRERERTKSNLGNIKLHCKMIADGNMLEIEGTEETNGNEMFVEKFTLSTLQAPESRTVEEPQLLQIRRPPLSLKEVSDRLDQVSDEISEQMNQFNDLSAEITVSVETNTRPPKVILVNKVFN